MKKLSRSELKNLLGGDAPAEWCKISCSHGLHTCVDATCVVINDSYAACVRGEEKIYRCYTGVIEA